MKPAEGSEARRPDRADYESTPLTRQEYISAIVHLYRGELSRADQWRMRLDNTTNWAILSCVGLMSFAFGDVQHSHWVLLFGLMLVSAFWIFEARRFRLYCVWRARVRMIEENFYAPILQRNPVSPSQDWGALVAEDLFHPTFKIGRLASLRARLVRNYWAIFGILLVAWAFKITLHPWQATGWWSLKRNLGESFFLPWWTPFVIVGAFFTMLAFVLVVGGRGPRDEGLYWREKKPRLSHAD